MTSQSTHPEPPYPRAGRPVANNTRPRVSDSQYYFNPENTRFRSRAEAVRHYGLEPVNAPKARAYTGPLFSST